VRTASPPLPSGDAVVQTFPAKSQLAVGGWVTLGTVVVAILGAVAGGLYVHSALPAAVVTPIVLLLVPLAVGFIRLGTHGPVLTTTRLLLPNFLRGWQTIELADVCGVGLRYYLSPQTSTAEWRLLLWLDDGSRRFLQIGAVRRLGTWSTPFSAPKTEEQWRHEWALLADSRAGRAARQIADRVRLVQGEGGIYERRHREVSAAANQSETDYWSPDGRVGRLP